MKRILLRRSLPDSLADMSLIGGVKKLPFEPQAWRHPHVEPLPCLRTGSIARKNKNITNHSQLTAPDVTDAESWSKSFPKWRRGGCLIPTNLGEPDSQSPF